MLQNFCYTVYLDLHVCIVCVCPCRVFQFSDDEEETKRVVRSAKDKRYSSPWLVDSINLWRSMDFSIKFDTSTINP